MAPAAFHTIEQNLEDFQVNETWYDKIITGDLGEVGRTILLEFMKNKGRDLSQLHMDCGMEIYDKEQQDTHSGGSGCGCHPLLLHPPQGTGRHMEAGFICPHRCPAVLGQLQ